MKGNHGDSNLEVHSWTEERTRACLSKKDSKGRTIYYPGPWTYYHILPHKEPLKKSVTNTTSCSGPTKERRTVRGNHNNSNYRDHNWIQERARTCNNNKWSNWGLWVDLPHSEPLISVTRDASSGCVGLDRETTKKTGNHGNSNYRSHTWTEERTRVCQLSSGRYQWSNWSPWRQLPHQEVLINSQGKCSGVSSQKNDSGTTSTRVCIRGLNGGYYWSSWNPPLSSSREKTDPIPPDVWWQQ